MWQKTCFLVHTDGEARPALDWMAQYVKDNPVGVNENISVLPNNFELEQNFPNPFNPATNIRYNIANTTKVTLKVYDILGRKCRLLLIKFNHQGNIVLNLMLLVSLAVYIFISLMLEVLTQ
ncbi:MAG: T9SS type A sorting domain-containing protein [Ignavibacteriales bacterium]|nr:T9SS type A sorting domain-containing protein [Ignavibacteriales bacterium]